MTRHEPATARELNQLAENHAENGQPSNALRKPPAHFSTVLLWADDLGINPTPAQWEAARALPAETTLADVLRFLGADLSEYGR